MFNDRINSFFFSLVDVNTLLLKNCRGNFPDTTTESKQSQEKQKTAILVYISRGTIVRTTVSTIMRIKNRTWYCSSQKSIRTPIFDSEFRTQKDRPKFDLDWYQGRFNIRVTFCCMHLGWGRVHLIFAVFSGKYSNSAWCTDLSFSSLAIDRVLCTLIVFNFAGT